MIIIIASVYWLNYNYVVLNLSLSGIIANLVFVYSIDRLPALSCGIAVALLHSSYSKYQEAPLFLFDILMEVSKQFFMDSLRLD